MGKRDLKINYQMLYNISKTLKSYKRALEDMEKAVTSIEGIIDRGKGQSVQKLVGKTEEFKGKIKEVKGELDDLSSIFGRYIKEMNAIISPITRDKIMEVDRDDIYWNKQDIISACESVTSIPVNVGASGLSGGFTLNDSKEETEKKKRNYQKLMDIKRTFANSYKEFEPYINKLNDVYKLVQEYEDKDDDFKEEASGLTDKYTDFFEGFSKFLRKAWNGIKSFAKGLLASAKDLVTGLVTMGEGVFTYSVAALEIGLDKLIGVEPPNWSQDYFDKGNNLIANIVRDPSIIVEGMGQGISDAWEEKGAAYSVGYVTGMVASAVLADKGLSKLSKGGKAAGSIDDVIEAGTNEAIEGVGTAEDLLKRGVNSVDGLEGLGITSAEKLSQAGITGVEDLLKFGVKSVDDLKRLGLTSAEQLSKIGIKDVNQLVEKGIISEKELAEIGIKGVSKTYKLVNASSADNVNDIFKETLGYEPPYKPGTMVSEIELTKKTTFVRVYDKINSRMQGGWIMKAEDLKGLSPKEIQNKFALPTTPKYICDVNLEVGTKLRTGEVNPLFGFEGGGQQYDLIINGKNVGTFENERMIGQ